ncbi:hypothetical protein GGS26DRAFT_563123 [Hypomontagnella submonticulosa]|nr:hypothetical protein GGS26DRAFT_563123 [Hypomontagnella submonticulosa]
MSAVKRTPLFGPSTRFYDFKVATTYIYLVLLLLISVSAASLGCPLLTSIDYHWPPPNDEQRVQTPLPNYPVTGNLRQNVVTRHQSTGYFRHPKRTIFRPPRLFKILSCLSNHYYG